jgi:hypothetical protein
MLLLIELMLVLIVTMLPLMFTIFALTAATVPSMFDKMVSNVSNGDAFILERYTPL